MSRRFGYVVVFVVLNMLFCLEFWETATTIHTKAAASEQLEEEAKVVVSIPPSRMKVHYHEMWNHTTSTIHVPEEYKNPFDAWIVVVNETDGTTRRRRPKTSLEILEGVLNGPKYRSEFEKVDAYVAEQLLLRNNNKKKNATTAASLSSSTTTTQEMPKCLLPDVKATRELAKTVQKWRETRKEQQKQSRRSLGDHNKLVLPLPILNVGYPKVGSSTLRDYFNCIGLKANHGQLGALMFENLAKGNPLFRSHAHDVYAQLDRNFGIGYYPQISLLDELHELHPNSTMVMNFRPILDWIRSAEAWANMKGRFALFDVPGLVFKPEHREHLEKWRRIKESLQAREVRSHPLRKKMGNSLIHAQLAKWWCGHVLHLREYVQEYPGHSLIELDLYDSVGTEEVLYDLFRADTEAEDPTTNNGTATKNATIKKLCWGHANANKRLSNNKKNRNRKRAR